MLRDALRWLRSTWCRLAGHRHERAGTVTVKGFRQAVLVVCTRCGKLWRGVRP